MTLTMGGPAASEGTPSPMGLDIVAHIRGRGDVRFQDTPWVGRLGPGLWIEAFMILARNRSAAAAIEYKGLTASGAETPWTDSGELCGSRGRSTPLIGFAAARGQLGLAARSSAAARVGFSWARLWASS